MEWTEVREANETGARDAGDGTAGCTRAMTGGSDG